MKRNSPKVMCISALFFLASCGGGDRKDGPVASQPALPADSQVSPIATIGTEGGELRLADGERLIIPPGGVAEKTRFEISKQGNTYEFLPDGLKSAVPMKFSIPITPSMVSDQDKVLSFQLYSDASPVVNNGTGEFRAERMFFAPTASLRAGGVMDMPFSHFSRGTLWEGGRIYIPLYIPAKYLRKGDILFSLSTLNFEFCSRFGPCQDAKDNKLDWFPGHVGMIIDPAGKAECMPRDDGKACDSIESTQYADSADGRKYGVRTVRLGDGFLKNAGAYMGARRPKGMSLTEDERNALSDFAVKQVGKPYTLLNFKPVWTNGVDDKFSCIGLVGISYAVPINKAIKNQRGFTWYGSDLSKPHDLYIDTDPVNEIWVLEGDDVAIGVNPIFLSQDKTEYQAYYKDVSGVSSDFKFEALNLPVNSQFDFKTGFFKWSVPASAVGQSFNVTFRATNSWPGLISNKSISTKSESLTLNVVPLRVSGISPSTLGRGVPTLVTVSGVNLPPDAAFSLDQVVCDGKYTRTGTTSISQTCTAQPGTASVVPLTVKVAPGGRIIQGDGGKAFGVSVTEPSMSSSPKVFAGAYQSFALKGSGAVLGWGMDSTKEASAPILAPVQVPGLSDIKAIALGMGYFLALKSDGTVWAWGGNYAGVLGIGSMERRNIPVQIPGLSNVTAIAAGSSNSLAVTTDGSVWAWGSNDYGILGYLPTTSTCRTNTTTCSSIPGKVPGISGAISVAVGGAWSAKVLKADGTVWAWGVNLNGELGISTDSKCVFVFSANCVLSPTQVPGVTDIVAISAGDSNTLALRRDGSVLAWGGSGIDLGLGEVGQVNVPTKLGGLSEIVAISTATSASSGTSSAALRADGTVWVWGRNSVGQLGIGTTSASPTPVRVANLNDVVSVATGGNHMLALKRDGTVWAWGFAGLGALGTGRQIPANELVPVRVIGEQSSASLNLNRQ